MSRGLQFDFNYTYSKSIDFGSNAERVSMLKDTASSQVINSWVPNQMSGVLTST